LVGDENAEEEEAEEYGELRRRLLKLYLEMEEKEEEAVVA